MDITVWHNMATDFAGRSAGLDGYEDGHPLTPVFQYTVPDRENEGLRYYADRAYMIFNVGDDPEFNRDLTQAERDVATQYRWLRNRSLSVGDVVQVGDAWLACHHTTGWFEIGAPRYIARNVKTSGTTPLDRLTRLQEPR